MIATGRIPGVQPCHDTSEAWSEARAPGVSVASSAEKTDPERTPKVMPGRAGCQCRGETRPCQTRQDLRFYRRRNETGCEIGCRSLPPRGFRHTPPCKITGEVCPQAGQTFLKKSKFKNGVDLNTDNRRRNPGQDFDRVQTDRLLRLRSDDSFQ